MTAHILERYGAVVQDGPFAHMIFASEASNSSLAPKIIGSYEAELHDVIRNLVSNDYATIINIGCAEGYYAVGLARLFPCASVHAFDIDPLAQRLCDETAQSNGVAVTIHGECTAKELNRLVSEFDRSLIVCDCEGAEVEILNPSIVERLWACDMLVELHDFVDSSISTTIRSRFQNSHEIRIIDAQPRNPAAYSVRLS